MNDTYSKQSKRQSLSITLRELGIDESTPFGLGNANNYNSLFVNLTTFTPTNQSHLGTKFSFYKKLNNRTLEDFLGKLFSGLGVKSIYLYEVFEPQKNGKTNLYKHVCADTDTMLCLHCTSGIRNSLYMSVRNALAHGNITFKDGFYSLYSIHDDKKEYDSPITFFLRLKSLKMLEAFVKVLNLYK